MGVYLSRPNVTKESHVGDSDNLRFGVSAMQGWRMNMEDAHITLPKLTEDIALFAVFDGHGGQEVAKFCAKYFPTELLKNEAFKKENFKEALEQTFLRMDELLQGEDSANLLREFRNDADNAQSFAGCTANVALITRKEVYVANAGDSRTIVYTKDGKVIPLSFDHKPDVETERARIHQAGGYVSEGRVNDNLNLTRAIGDLEYKKNPVFRPEQQIISAFPDVMVKPIESTDLFLVLGCDGIWETLTSKDICVYIDSKISASPDNKLSTIAEEVLDKLVAKDTMEGVGCDNMSCIIIQLKH